MKCEMPTWCNKVILLMYSSLDMFRVHTRLSRPPPTQKLGAENRMLQLNI